MRLPGLLFAAVLAVGCAKTVVKPETSATPAVKPDDARHTNIQPLLATQEGARKAFDAKPKAGDLAICAVSDEPFTVTDETKVAEFEGKWYAFCCDECEPSFKANPAQYTRPAAGG